MELELDGPGDHGLDAFMAEGERGQHGTDAEMMEMIEAATGGNADDGHGGAPPVTASQDTGGATTGTGGGGASDGRGGRGGSGGSDGSGAGGGGGIGGGGDGNATPGGMLRSGGTMPSVNVLVQGHQRPHSLAHPLHMVAHLPSHAPLAHHSFPHAHPQQMATLPPTHHRGGSSASARIGVVSRGSATTQGRTTAGVTLSVTSGASVMQMGAAQPPASAPQEQPQLQPPSARQPSPARQPSSQQPSAPTTQRQVGQIGDAGQPHVVSARRSAAGAGGAASAGSAAMAGAQTGVMGQRTPSVMSMAPAAMNAPMRADPMTGMAGGGAPAGGSGGGGNGSGASRGPASGGSGGIGRRCGVCEMLVVGHNAATCPQRRDHGVSDESARTAALKKLRRCNYCKQMVRGHNATTCPENPANKGRKVKRRRETLEAAAAAAAMRRNAMREHQFSQQARGQQGGQQDRSPQLSAQAQPPARPPQGASEQQQQLPRAASRAAAEQQQAPPSTQQHRQQQQQQQQQAQAMPAPQHGAQPHSAPRGLAPGSGAQASPSVAKASATTAGGAASLDYPRRVCVRRRKAPAQGGHNEVHWPARAPMPRGATRHCARRGCKRRSIWHCPACALARRAFDKATMRNGANTGGRRHDGAPTLPVDAPSSLSLDDLVYLCVDCFEMYHTGKVAPGPVPIVPSTSRPRKRAGTAKRRRVRPPASRPFSAVPATIAAAPHPQPLPMAPVMNPMAAAAAAAISRTPRSAPHIPHGAPATAMLLTSPLRQAPKPGRPTPAVAAARPVGMQPDYSQQLANLAAVQHHTSAAQLYSANTAPLQSGARAAAGQQKGAYL